MSFDAFHDNVRGAFDRLTDRLNGLASGPLHTKRRAGLSAFEQLGIPTTRHEEWKYTNVLPFMGLAYADPTQTGSLTDHEVSTVLGDLADTMESGWRCTMINGRFVPERSILPPSESGITIRVLDDAAVRDDAHAAAFVGSLAHPDAHPFVALNTALAADGVLIRVPKGVRVERPLHIAVITDVRAENRLATPRIVVFAEEGSEIDIVESHHTIGSETALDISVTEVDVRANAHVRYHHIVDDGAALRHIGQASATVASGGRFTSHSVNIGGAFVRNDLAVRLADPSAETYLYGVSVLGGKEYADNHTVVDHTVPHCHSEELYKGIYDGQSTGVFNGKIYVRPQAQKTTAYQSSHAILLSDKAQMNAKPQLEIWADDVKCSHGATTGQLDEDAIFYLRARGIDADKARALMTYAFVAEVIEHMDHEALRTYCEKRIADKLHAEPFSL
jgi:Fe-S cluster assembly protein SufD